MSARIATRNDIARDVSGLSLPGRRVPGATDAGRSVLVFEWSGVPVVAESCLRNFLGQPGRGARFVDPRRRDARIFLRFTQLP